MVGVLDGVPLGTVVGLLLGDTVGVVVGLTEQNKTTDIRKKIYQNILSKDGKNQI